MADNNSSLSKPPNFGPSLRSRLVLVGLIALCIVFVTSYTHKLKVKSQVLSEIRQNQQRVDETKQKNLVLQQRYDYVMSPDYVDNIAREDLDMAKKDDTVIVVVPSTPPPITQTTGISGAITAAAVQQFNATGNASSVTVTAAPNHAATTDTHQVPVWQQWFSLFAPSPDSK